jgi:NTE family protein
MKHRYLIALCVLFCLCAPQLVAEDQQQTFVLGNSLVKVTSYGYHEESPITVALVLSGGGARGFAHIPIIEAIERHGIPVDMVLGTSMGSLVGGLYAAGYSPGDMRRLIRSYDMVELFALPAQSPVRVLPMPLRRDRDNLFVLGFDEGGLGSTSGIIGDQRILHMLNDTLSRVSGITDFDKLAIPFRCIGADLASGERIIFSEGSLVTAIRSSISIPLVFTPYPVGDRMVIDGGIVDNMPVNLAREMGADIVIAVDVNAVDYEISNEELDSITAILAQLVVILTKNTVIPQNELADLLITPELTEHDILDFLAVDEIIAVGQQSALKHESDFARLADHISTFRPLQPKDPNRYGPYFSLPDVYVERVSHRAIGNYQDSQMPLDLSLFDEFVGFPLDTMQKNRLNHLFEQLRDSGSFATVTYDYTDAKQGKGNTTYGNLTILTRQFPPKRSTISAGVFGAISLVIPRDDALRFHFTPDFALRYYRYELFDSDTMLTVTLSNDDALTFSSQLQTAVTPRIDAEVRAGYVTGGIHPLNLRDVQRELDVRDRMITSELLFAYQPSFEALFTLSADFDYIWYGESVIGRKAAIVSVRSEGVYTTLPYRFFPRSGFRFDYQAVAELSDPLGYRIEARLQKSIPLGDRNVISFDLHAGSAHVTHPRKQSYFDYGGSRGIPSYPAHTLVDDMVLGRIKYHRWVTTALPQVVLQAMVTVSSRGDSVFDLLSQESPFTCNAGLPFSSLGPIEYSGSLAAGLAFENIDLLFGVALDNHLQTSIFFEVL